MELMMVVEEGRKSSLNAMKLMMDRAKLPKTIKRTICKKNKGAKSFTKKGKLMGNYLTDSSQQGIKRFFKSNSRELQNGMEIGHGDLYSLGSPGTQCLWKCKKL